MSGSKRSMRRGASRSLLVGVLSLAVVASACSDATLEEECRGPSGSFPQPELRCSDGGELDTTLTAKVETNVVRNNFPTIDPEPTEMSVTGPTYEGALIGPTLRLRQGDDLKIDFRNRLPDNPTDERKGAFPHGPFTTNFHTHGLTVSPLGISDNVLRRFLPGEDYPIEVNLPDDHPSGTFWYHPHKHGSVSFQFFGGMAGFLVVEGGEGTLDTVPEVAAAEDVLMGFQVLRTDTAGNTVFVNPTSTMFSGQPAGQTENGNCTNAPFRQCAGLDGPTGELCETDADCPSDTACVGRSCATDEDCSDEVTTGRCAHYCDLAGPPDADSQTCTDADQCPGQDGAAGTCTGWTVGCVECGLFDPYRNGLYFLTTNGVTNPTLRMQPGEVQRWRLLNGASGLALVLEVGGVDGAPDLPIHVIAQDGITLNEMVTLEPGRPYVMGAGNRVDLLVRAPSAGTYQLRAVDPNCSCGTSCPGSETGACTSPGKWPLSLSGADVPWPRSQKIGFDFQNNFTPGATNPDQVLQYPLPLATIEVSGESVDMGLPSGSLPVPGSLPSVEAMRSATPAAHRRVAFEICGTRGPPQDAFAVMGNPQNRPPSCGWFYEKYDAEYWGGIPFTNLTMMRDADDVGVPSTANPEVLRVDYQKEGLFDASAPLFDMAAGTIEEWTLINRSFSDHPFHIHQNPFLVTHVSGVELPLPEWRDVIIVPSAYVPGSEDLPAESLPGGIPISRECTDGRQNPGCDLDPTSPNFGKGCCVSYGTIRFRMYLDPIGIGQYVMHCHILDHEDIGMMQLLEMVPGQP